MIALFCCTPGCCQSRDQWASGCLGQGPWPFLKPVIDLRKALLHGLQRFNLGETSIPLRCPWLAIASVAEGSEGRGGTRTQ